MSASVFLHALGLGSVGAPFGGRARCESQSHTLPFHVCLVGVFSSCSVLTLPEAPEQRHRDNELLLTIGGTHTYHWGLNGGEACRPQPLG